MQIAHETLREPWKRQLERERPVRVNPPGKGAGLCGPVQSQPGPALRRAGLGGRASDSSGFDTGPRLQEKQDGSGNVSGHRAVPEGTGRGHRLPSTCCAERDQLAVRSWRGLGDGGFCGNARWTQRHGRWGLSQDRSHHRLWGGEPPWLRQHVTEIVSYAPETQGAEDLWHPKGLRDVPLKCTR